MSDTILLEVTPKEHQLILAERKREADELERVRQEKLKKAKLEENNNAAASNKKHCEAAMSAIKSSIDIFDFELADSDAPFVLQTELVCMLTRRLLVKMEVGMGAFIKVSNDGIAARKISKTLLSACVWFPVGTEMLLSRTLEKMQTVIWRDGEGGILEEEEDEPAQGSNKRKRG